MAREWQLIYNRSHARGDGMPGFLWAFGSAAYRPIARAKAWDLRRQAGEPDDGEEFPETVEELLEFMLEVSRGDAEGYVKRLDAEERARRKGQVILTAGPEVPLLACGPLLHSSGYSDDFRGHVLGLCAAGQEVKVVPVRWGPEDPGIPAEDRRLLDACCLPPGGLPPAEVFISHTLAWLQQPHPGAGMNVARTMFEMDRLQPDMVQRLQAFDQIWVPSEFNRDTFVASGLTPEKIRVIPGTLDCGLWISDCGLKPEPLRLADLGLEIGEDAEGRTPYVFLSVFDWNPHKGWDVLLEGFCREFGDDSSVQLLIKTWSSNGLTIEEVRTEADTLLRERLGKGLEQFPNVHLWQELLPATDLPRLYAAVDCFVLPTRGEGWCRPLMEAMAAGLPTLATGWSGLTAFHDAKVGYPVKHRLMPVPEAVSEKIGVFRGCCWAEPDLADLRRLMRLVVTRPDAARKKGAAAQRRIRTKFSREAVGKLLVEALQECRALAATREPAGAPAPTAPVAAEPVRPQRPHKPSTHTLHRDPPEPVDFREALGRPLRLVIEGDQTLLSSLAACNRELGLGLLAAGDVELCLREKRTPWHTLSGRDEPRWGPLFARLDAPLSGPPDITVRHNFPPVWDRPEAGKLAVIQPWEYAHLPEDWVEACAAADEVWAYSRFVRAVWVRGGVSPDKVPIVPLGYDPALFYPAAERDREGKFTFLFVGGALDRKGADLVLLAYLQAFRRGDPVRLVVKDMGTRTFYRGATFGDAFRNAANGIPPPGGIGRAGDLPEIVYTDADLSGAALGDLYREGDCLLGPYRGEGFCLPALEGLACGLFPIVTAGGPTDDFLDDECAFRLPYRRRYAGKNWVGPDETLGFRCVGDPWQFEPELEALVHAMRWAFENREEARNRAEAGRKRVAEEWTWDRAVLDARRRLFRMLFPPTPTPPQELRQWKPPVRRKGGKGAEA